MNNFKIDTISKNLWHWKCTKILEADIIGLDYFSDWPAIWPGGGGTAKYGLYRYVPLGRVWFSSSLL